MNESTFPTFYYYDTNRRVYEMNGVKKSSPFEDGYYVRIKILSETDKEFICEPGVINKKTMLYNRGRGSEKRKVYTHKEKDDLVYIAENRHKIESRLRGLSADGLRKVEQILIDNNI